MSIGVGIVGAGGVCLAHLQAYAQIPDVNVVALCDVDRELCQSTANEFHVPVCSSDYKSLLADPKIDLMDICLPTYLHHPVAMAAVQAGKNVLLEKPIAMNLREADEMIEAAAEAGVKLYVAFNQRLMPVHRKVKEMLASSEIGRPFLAMGTIIGDEFARMNQSDNWKGTWDRAGGGAFGDSGIHQIDLMNYWFGVPEAISLTANRYVVECEHKAEDTAAAVIEYPGVMVNLVVTYSAIGDAWRETKEIFGTGGSLHVLNEDSKPLRRVIGKGQNPETVEVEHFPGSSFGGWWNYSIFKGLQHFIGCLMSDTEPIVTAEDARLTLRVMLAGYESAKTGRRIKITEI